MPEQLLNIEFILVTFEVSQLLTSGLNTGFQQLLNIELISVTLDVSNLSAPSKSVMFQHPPNHPAQLIGAIV